MMIDGNYKDRLSIDDNGSPIIDNGSPIVDNGSPIVSEGLPIVGRLDIFLNTRKLGGTKCAR